MELPENINFLSEEQTAISYNEFFKMNNLLDKKYEGCTFVLYGSNDYPITLNLEYINNTPYIIYINSDRDGYKGSNVSSLIFKQPNNFFKNNRNELISVSIWKDCHIVKLIIITPNNNKQKEYKREEYVEEPRGGRKASVKKEICGRLRCIYKIQGSRKEHIKYKGRLITVADYKKLMKKA